MPLSRVGFGLGGELIGRRALPLLSLTHDSDWRAKKNAAADTCESANVGLRLRVRTQPMNREMSDAPDQSRGC